MRRSRLLINILSLSPFRGIVGAEHSSERRLGRSGRGLRLVDDHGALCPDGVAGGDGGAREAAEAVVAERRTAHTQH